MDENLSVLLPKTAHARGYEATHVNYYGLNQSKDWDILRVVTQEDWILVTKVNTALDAGYAGDQVQVTRYRLP